MKNFFYGFYWSGVWIGIFFLASTTASFPSEVFIFFFIVAVVLSWPWSIFVLLLGLFLIGYSPSIREFFLLLAGGEGRGLGPAIGALLTGMPIGLHINGMLFISYRKKRQQRRMEKEKEQEQAQRQVQEKT